MFYIIVLYAIGFVMNTFFNGLYDAYFSLDFAMIFKGQVWRLVTFILQPPSNSIIFVVFVLYFYYLIGSVLERIWGSFRFNVYFFTGVILNILASLIIYLIWGLSFKLSTNYINLALFMAFAMEQPDMEVLLFFIIPIKYSDILCLFFQEMYGTACMQQVSLHHQQLCVMPTQRRHLCQCWIS